LHDWLSAVNASAQPISSTFFAAHGPNACSSAGHDALSVYGIGKHRRVDEWRNLARALLHQGLISEAQDGYSVLSLNANSWPVLRGELPVSIARAEKPARRSQDRAARASTTDDSLFERLRALRKTAGGRERPAAVCHFS